MILRKNFATEIKNQVNHDERRIYMHVNVVKMFVIGENPLVDNVNEKLEWPKTIVLNCAKLITSWDQIWMY